MHTFHPKDRFSYQMAHILYLFVIDYNKIIVSAKFGLESF